MNSAPFKPILYLDCFSGLSGDMIVSALLDVGVPFTVIEEAVSALPLSGYRIRHEKEIRNAISVCRFFVAVEEAKQPHRHFSQIRDIIEGSTLNDRVKRTSIAIFEVLAKAEAKVHGTTIEEVHFHEVGAVDSIIDIVATAAAIDHLNATVACARVPLGRGFVNTQHGLLPLPAPATLAILEGVPVEGTDVESELTTPTGAAIVKALATQFGPIPPMTPTRVGFGAGSRSLPNRPGILRAVLGQNHSQRKFLLVVFTNEPCKRNHAFMHALDLSQHGHIVKLLIEGEATQCLGEREGKFGELFALADQKGLIAGACKTAAHGCSTGDLSRNVVELAKQQNIQLISGMREHAAIGDYVSSGFELVTY
ncbi:MAG: LarC family nickel insertion protein [Deltaproteobacteria bacterium]|nr:LarC family nickel insertion protein [Deltaproteobacteria bacterium]